MSRRTIVTMALALIFGLSAVVLINLFNRGQGEAPKPETVQIVVASASIPRGSAIKANQVKTREWPKDALLEGAITKVEDAIDRVTLSGIVKDEPVLDGKLTAKGVGPGVGHTLRRGMRAFTIHTPTPSSGVAGFILPGNKVDVLLTVSGGGPNDLSGGGITITLLQYVEILAVDQRLDAPADNRVDTRELRSVTLLATPDQVNKLCLAQDRGTLHLSLRNPDDVEVVETQPVRLIDLPLSQEQPLSKLAKKEDSPPPAPISSSVEKRIAEPPDIIAVRGTVISFVPVKLVRN